MKNTIHCVLILDQSGSMNDLKREVILSFNEQIDTILKMVRNNPNQVVKLTLCVFNDVIDFKFIDQDVDKIKKLTEGDYQPDCCTALYDAIGASILKVSEFSGPNDQVYLAIFTDGLENASRIYSAEDIQFKMQEAEKKGWIVNFFCRYEDRPLYRKKFKISDSNVIGISINENGLNVMDKQIRYCLKSMMDTQPDTGHE